MSQALFDQYKEALRRGHVAALRGNLEDAAVAYEAAAALAPDRALPCVGLADALRRLGRLDAAVEAYGLALRRSAADEGALRGRSATRALQRRPIDAARDLETLADVLEQAGRLPEACEAACDALDFAESRSRRRAVERLALRLGALTEDNGVRRARARMEGLLEPLAGAMPSAAVPGAGLPSAAIPGAGLPATVVPVAGPPAGSAAPAVSAPEPLPTDTMPPFDRVGARLEAEGHLAAGRAAEARPLLLAVAAAEREAGELDAALDACFALVEINPADAATQLELAANQVARGWMALAGEKIRLLERLASFSPVAESITSHAAIAAFTRDHPLEAAVAE